jgi:tetratricopeptide (TPR) repeat protein
VADSARVATLELIYQEYLLAQDSGAFLRQVTVQYTPSTLERLTCSASRVTRRGAVLALSYLSDIRSNAVLARALKDEDRGVRTLAENAMRTIWCRDGNSIQRQQLAAIIRLNNAGRFDDAITRATSLITHTPEIAEAWNQRAIAYYSISSYIQSIHDCRQALELNAYHFGAMAGMGQCYLQLGNHLWALESFRRAIAINPDLEGIRINITYLEQKLKKER